MPSTTDFESAAREALAARGFSPPRQAETCVLLFATGTWAAHPGAAALLDPNETRRAGRFRFARDRDAYVAAHALWRVVLGVCLDMPGHRVPLTCTPAGQPQVPGTDMATSISHSGAWVTFAVTSASTVGVDIEQLPSRHALDAVLDGFCTAAELAALATMEPNARQREALALWTRKEAALKAFGTGLSVDPSSFAVTPGQPIPPPPIAGGCAACVVGDLALGTAVVGALALPATPQPHRVRVFTMSPMS